jgi:hypothetical protein
VIEVANSLRLLLGAEYLMQVPLAPLHFGPSMFFLARREQPAARGRARAPGPGGRRWPGSSRLTLAGPSPYSALDG